jgi:hypothetical protein
VEDLEFENGVHRSEVMALVRRWAQGRPKRAGAWAEDADLDLAGFYEAVLKRGCELNRIVSDMPDHEKPVAAGYLFRKKYTRELAGFEIVDIPARRAASAYNFAGVCITRPKWGGVRGLSEFAQAYVAHRARNDYGIRFLSPGGAEQFESGIERFRSKIDKIGVEEIKLKTVAEVDRDLLGRHASPR